MKPTFVVFFILFSSFLGSPLQAQTLRAYEQAGFKALETKDYYSAMQFFSTVLEVKPDRMAIRYAYGDAARLFNSYSLAEAAYRQVSESAEKEDYPLLSFWLGSVYQRQGKYEKAISQFKAFLEQEGMEEAYVRAAQEAVISCEYAKTIMNRERVLAEVRNLGPLINSPFSDFGGIRQGDTLYYSSLQLDNPRNRTKGIHPKYARVLLATGEEEPVVEPWNIVYSRDTLSVAHVAFGRDGSYLFYNECQFINTNDLQCDLIYRKKQSDGRWGRPIRLPKPLNLPDFTTTQPSIGKDVRTGRDVLYFVSDRPGGKGKLDIWYAVLDNDGEPGEPVNLEAINTPEDETTPWYDPSTQNLYFSSNGYKGLGGLDIFRCYQSAGVWQQPEHLGYPVNSSYNDLYYYPEEGGKSALFSSNRPGSYYVDNALESCCFDLYEVIYSDVSIELVVRVMDQKKNDLLPAARIRLFDTNTRREQVFMGKPGEDFSIALEPGKVYQFISEQDGYISDTATVRTTGIRKDTRLNRVVFLTPQFDLPEDVGFTLVTLDAESRDSLYGVQVTLLDTGGKVVERTRLFNQASYSFLINRQETYYVLAEKEGYFPDTLRLHPGEEQSVSGDSPIQKTILLRYKPSTILTLSEFLPIPLFFDNNKPVRGQSSAHTYTTYSENFQEYYAVKEKFLNEYGGKGKDSSAIARRESMDAFFEEDIRAGYEAFQEFLKHLENYLQQGNKAELMIKGFASPLADARYNEILTRRRTQCLMNELNTFHEGVLNPYMEAGMLQITERPFGESQAPSNISDDRKDARSSIYSVEASRERRVEILEILGNEEGRSE